MARHWVCEQLAGELRDSELASAKLLISELVTNAVVHGRGVIVVSVRVDNACLHVDVKDDGKSFVPPIRAPSLDRAGGWGLEILDSVATHWGIGPGATTQVWFELERRAPPPPPSR